MGSGCVIVTFEMLDEDFIFFFSYLIPVFYIAFDSNEKSQSCSFCCFFFFKGQILVLILSRVLELERKKHVPVRGMGKNGKKKNNPKFR